MEGMTSEFFHPIDFLFAKKMGLNGLAHDFAAYLLAMGRMGHLWVDVDATQDPLLIEGAKQLALYDNDHFVQSGSRWYLRRNWECEEKFLRHQKRLEDSSPELFLSLDQIEATLSSFSLTREQKQAISNSLSVTLSLICGGPGTGKTRTAATLVRVFLAITNGKVALAAPTGKAAANLRLALKDLPCSVSTLHTLLRKKALFEDVILIDESSMIDAEMMASLFAAVKQGARLILIGDPHQLPPVEAGRLFVELASQKKEVSYLTTCLRAELKEIVEMGEKVLRGEKIPSLPLREKELLLKELIKRIPEIETQRLCVLTPFRRGIYGVDSLNQSLYAMHRRDAKNNALSIPIILKKNDTRRNLFNGDRGVLRGGKAYFSDGRTFSELLIPSYEYAYVQSVHKSQGSEYEKVIVLLPKGSVRFGKELLYTALTRAKKEIIIYSEMSEN